MESRECVIRTNAVPAVDYLTFHIWPLNWSWIDSKNLAKTYDVCEANTRKYIATHLKIAGKMNKPAVAEELGFPRDDGGYALSTPTSLRDRFYGLIFAMVQDSARKEGPFAGTNFWAWGGEDAPSIPIS